MLNILLILLLIHFIGLFIFKPNLNTLNCGIFGQCTNNPRKINQSNIKILGLFNESRGKHSCGITYDSEIFHGLEKDKLFSDFIKGKTFKPEVNPLIFGHTRSASVGAAINEHNAHPFGFGTNKTGGYKFIGVHNGTLYNHLELAKAYGINPKATYKGTYTDVELERTKIDSEILLEIIHTDRSYKVLSEYIGKAALVWTDTDAPNVTYLWSGQSRMTETYINGPEMEERPMNIWIDGKNSFYFSSMPESLEAIGAPSKDVFQIEYNTVYQVTNGDFKHALLTKVSRKQCFQTESYVSKSYNYGNGFNAGKQTGGSENVIDGTNVEDCCDWSGYQERFVNKVSIGATATLNKDKESGIVKLNIYNDKPLLDQNKYKNKVYSYKLRYWQKGHLVNGIFCHVPNYGFYRLGSTQNYARQEFDSKRGLRFFEGDFLTDPTILFGYVPFTVTLAVPTFYYFLDGVMLDTLLDYDTIKDNQVILKNTEQLSHATRHPIIDLTYDFKLEDKQDIYKDGKRYTGSIANLGFEKTYHVANGNLVKVIPKNNLLVDVEKKPVESEILQLPAVTTKVLAHNPEILKKSFENIKEIEELIIKEELLDKTASDKIDEVIISETDKIVTDMIDREITPCLMSLQNCREELDLLPAQNELVTGAKTLVNDVIQTINKFVN